MLHNDPIAAITPEVIAWRQQHPRQSRTRLQGEGDGALRRRSAQVASAWRLIGHRWNRHVGVLRSGRGTGRSGLSAELDALPVIASDRAVLCIEKEGVMHEVLGSLTERDPVNLGCRAAAQRRLPKRFSLLLAAFSNRHSNLYVRKFGAPYNSN